jgi:hypothetical protein
MYKTKELYTAQTGRQIFEVVEHYLVEQDPWVRYINTETLQEYTCRREAFQQRFSPLSA